MSTGPDGAVYLGNSPLRRLFARCLSLTTLPAVGGIRKFAPERLDLLLRDAACAASDRARNAIRHRRLCPDSVAADRVQLQELLAQSRAAASGARRWSSEARHQRDELRGIEGLGQEYLVAGQEGLHAVHR